MSRVKSAVISAWRSVISAATILMIAAGSRLTSFVEAAIESVDPSKMELARITEEIYCLKGSNI